MLPKRAPPTLAPSRLFMPRHVLVLVFAALVLALAAGGLWAAPLLDRHESDEALVGTVRIAGSRKAAFPVAQWAAILKRDHPNVHVVTMLYGGGTGAGALADGEADLVPLYRKFRPDERAMVAAANATPRLVEIGRSADGAKPMMLYVKPGGDSDSVRIAAEFVEIALSNEGRAALTP